MTIGERLDELDLRHVVPSFLLACVTIVALMLLIDRIQRVAKATTPDRSWTALTGTELRLAGLEQGPLLGVEASPGGGLTARASGSLAEKAPVRQLSWMSQGDSQSDNKAKVEISLLDPGGEVVLSRSGEAEIPKVRILVKHSRLRVDAGVTVGPSLRMPRTRAVFGGDDVPPTGPAFSFIVPAGETLAVEFPELPNSQASGVVTWLGPVGEEDTVLNLREVAVTQEGAETPDRSACAAGGGYAWAAFFQLSLFPILSGRDCKPGILTARNIKITDESVGVSIAGKAWEMTDGKPTVSLWSSVSDNPVLRYLLGNFLPWAVGGALGFISWRRRSAATPDTEPEAATSGTPGPARPPRKRAPAPRSASRSVRRTRRN